ncbi:MAG: nucleotidyltransferase family protein [Gammaproteobacteria bacterium]|nr:nucleotidyltransferase family protein [Gammaproteobacteria bacterium]
MPEAIPLNRDLCTTVFRDPRLVNSLGLGKWDLLAPQARQSNLLARLAVVLEENGLLSSVPPEVLDHLESARRLSERHVETVHWEVNRIQEALEPTGVPVILLKGAAYVLAGLPPAAGRIFSDVDIMVPKAAIPTVEKALRRRGWQSMHQDSYDQQYYREWMHEIPPLQHGFRQTVLDVHHTILPPTARLKPDPAALLAAAQPVKGKEELYVLAPTDMVLHSATHLFHDGDLENGLRDLVDLDALLRHFGADDGFWDALVDRAHEQDLARPLYYALTQAPRYLGTPIPDATLRRIQEGRARPPVAWLMDELLRRGLAPNHPSCDDALTGVARWALYVRSHWLRMPLHLLIPHLVRKAGRRTQKA